jgi:hypothetical protein
VTPGATVASKRGTLVCSVRRRRGTRDIFMGGEGGVEVGDEQQMSVKQSNLQHTERAASIPSISKGAHWRKKSERWRRQFSTWGICTHQDLWDLHFHFTIGEEVVNKAFCCC